MRYNITQPFENMYHIMKRIFNYDESEIYHKSILAHSNKILLNDFANYFAFQLLSFYFIKG